MIKTKRTAAVVLSLIIGTSGMTVSAIEENVYLDYIPEEIPENLILSADNWSNVVYMPEYVKYQASGSDLNMEVLQTNTNRWWVFGGMSIPAKGKILDFGGFKAGKTYVFQSMVKRLSGEDAIPYYGLAVGDGKYNYATTPATDIYGKDGMAVTSTDWMPFRDTLTIPENYTVAEASQTLHTGLRVQNTADLGSSVAIQKSLVNASVEGSMDTDGFYLAEEILYDIKIYGEENELNCNEPIDLRAEVVNQVGIQGTLKQNFNWYAVNSERTEIENTITVTETSEGSATVSVSENTEYGTYYIIAESEDYEGFRKGFEIEVKKAPLQDYQPEEGTGEFSNYIQKPQNSGFAKVSSDNVKMTVGDGYVIIEALADVDSNLGVEGLRVRNVGTNGLPLSFNFEPGKTYLIKAKVRNPEPENDTYFNVSISNSNTDTLAFTTQYGSEGLLLTEEWQEFVGSIIVSENYDIESSDKNLTLGLNSGSIKGSKAEVELSVYVGDVVPYDIAFNFEKNEVLGADDSFEVSASIVDIIGNDSGFSQEFEWYLLDDEKVNKIDALDIEISEDSTTAKVLTDIYSESGVYYLVAKSKKYEGFIKSIRIDVDKPSPEECIKEAIKSANKETLADNVEEYISFLNIMTEIENINYENLAEIIVNSRNVMDEENAIDFIKKAIVISAFEYGENLYDSENNFKYDEELNLKELDKNGVTVYSLFLNEITSEGKKAFQKAIKGNYSSFEEFEKKFIEQVLLKSIQYPVKSGMGTLELILTKENVEVADFEIDEYLSLKNKIDAAEYILNKEFTKEELEKTIAVIENTIEKAEDNKKPAGNKGGSSSGGGYSGGSSIIIAPSITNNNVNSDEDTETDSELGKEGTFTDVDEKHWAYRDIYYLDKRDIISGIGNGLFNPEGNVTREQFVKMICEAFQYETVNEVAGFSDVVSGTWYEKYITTAVKNGIISGMDDGKFGVGKVITREDMAVIINRAMGGNVVEDQVGDFNDYEEISEYARESVSFLQAFGVINGFDDGNFRPKAECTRAQAAKIICNVLKLRGDEM